LPYELLFSTILAAQCTDARVNIVARTLYKKYPTLESFSVAPLEELEQDIRSTGFYHNKAKSIVASAQMLLDEFGGAVPDTMEALLRLPGVGRKIANLILGDVFGKPAVVVDTHCIRISNLLGLVKTENPFQIEKELRKLLPPEAGARFCHQIVAHGRALCVARRPKCALCGANGFCAYGRKAVREA
jgi:endonuclease-3